MLEHIGCDFCEREHKNRVCEVRYEDIEKPNKVTLWVTMGSRIILTLTSIIRDGEKSKILMEGPTKWSSWPTRWFIKSISTKKKSCLGDFIEKSETHANSFIKQSTETQMSWISQQL